MLKKGEKIGLICCSNGKPPKEKAHIKQLVYLLEQQYDLNVCLASTIYQKKNTVFSGTPQERGEALMLFYTDPSIKMIFDLSGGDVANEILPYLDYEAINKANKPFVGYSDLTVILNAIYAQTSCIGYNYQVLHLLEVEKQQEHSRKTFIEPVSLIAFHYCWLTSPVPVTGIAVGGNIRCFLKLAGTPYWPEITNKILFLEANGGKIEKIAAYFAQLDQTGAFKNCGAILLGQFTTIQAEKQTEQLDELIRFYAEQYAKPVLKTEQIGHSTDSLPFPIGKELSFV